MYHDTTGKSTQSTGSFPDIFNDLNLSEEIESQDNSLAACCHQFHFPDTATLPFSQLKRTQEITNAQSFHCFFKQKQKSQTNKPIE